MGQGCPSGVRILLPERMIGQNSDTSLNDTAAFLDPET